MSTPIETMLDDLAVYVSRTNQEQIEPLIVNSTQGLRFLNEAQDLVIALLPVECLDALNATALGQSLSLGEFDLTTLADAMATLAITDVDTGAKTFKIAGDYRDYLKANTRFTIASSTGNDGTYIVSAVSYSSVTEKTTITVVSIPNATADGNIVVPGSGRVFREALGVRTVRLHGGKRCEFVPHVEYQILQDEGVTFTVNNPIWRTVDDHTIAVEPYADQTIDIHYRRVPAVMSIDASTPANNVDCDFDNTIQRAIISKAAALAFRYFERYDRAKAAEDDTDYIISRVVASPVLKQ